MKSPISNTEYQVIFRGTTSKTRHIEVYLPEYDHSQAIRVAPYFVKQYFCFTTDKFWETHPELNDEFHKLCRTLGFKHLFFVLGMDFSKKPITFEYWNFMLKFGIEDEHLDVNEDERKLALNSFYNKYSHQKGKRFYEYTETSILDFILNV